MSRRKATVINERNMSRKVYVSNNENEEISSTYWVAKWLLSGLETDTIPIINNKKK